jgi:hypothetical protein
MYITTIKNNSNLPSYADIWQPVYNGIIRLYSKPDSEIIKKTRFFKYKTDENNIFFQDDRTLVSYNNHERLTFYGVEFTGLPKNRTILFLLNVGLIVEISRNDVYLLDLFDRQEIYNDRRNILNQAFQEIIKSTNNSKLKKLLIGVMDSRALASSNIDKANLDLSCNDRFYPVLVTDYQKSLEQSNLDKFKALDNKIEPFIVNLFKQYFNRKVTISDISYDSFDNSIFLAEFYEKEPIDHCLIPYSGSGEYILNISKYGISSVTLNEFAYDLSNTELDFQYYNDIYLNDSRIKEIDINNEYLKDKNIHIILGYHNAKQFIDNINGQSLYKATKELDSLECPDRELSKDEFMSQMEQVYDWYLTSNRCFAKEINDRHDAIQMKLSELGLDSNFNVI